jgi:eukaryotic-like serine/threonine-protein kinase
MLGRVIAGRFTVLSRIGEGAMGTVYRAKQAPMGREVAVKILRSERALDEASRARFLREARANSLLTSPNTVTVHDFGAGESGEFYLAMELLEGESLGQRLKRMGRLDPAAAIDTARQALRSLAEAHAKGIIHRDLKPDNLFYARVRTNETYEEIVKVLDFGIAKMLRADEELAMNAVETQAGTVFGTPRYMSPEQAQGKLLDPRSDLYSLGVILYQMLTGRPPFTDDDAIVVMARHIKTPPRPIREAAPEAHVPPEIENAVMRVLSKDPEGRPQSADVMSTELARVRDSALSVTSGVRTSLPTPEVATSMAEPLALSPGTETLEEAKAAFGPKSRRGWIAGVAAVIVASAVALAVANVRGRSEPSPAPPPASAAALRTEDQPLDVPSAIPAAAIAEAPAVPVRAEVRQPPPAGSRPAATVEPKPATSSNAANAPRTTTHQHGGAGRPVAPPATTASGSVGYGYLE